MNPHYLRECDYDEPSNEELGITPFWSFEQLLGAIITVIAVALSIAFMVSDAYADVGKIVGSTWQMKDVATGRTIASNYASAANCDAAIALKASQTKTAGQDQFYCLRLYTITYVAAPTPPPTCPALPAPRLQTCPSGYSGAGWQQQPQQSAYPACAITWAPTQAPAGACTLIPVNSVTLSWTPPTQNDDGTALTDLAGYRIVYGKSPTALSQAIDIPLPNVSTYRVESLAPSTWYFAVIAYNKQRAESKQSNVVSRVIQ